MTVKFTDNSDFWNNAVREGCNDGITDMASFYADAFRMSVGSEGGGAIATSRPVGKSGKRRYKKLLEGQSIGKNEGRRYFKASPPGSFPGNRTGALRRSMVSTKASGLVAYAGSTLKYAGWLETGWERRTPLTDKQKRYLHALAKQLKDAGVAVTWQKGAKGGAVWARPWLRRTVREQRAAAGFVFQTTAADSIAKRVAQ